MKIIFIGLSIFLFAFQAPAMAKKVCEEMGLGIEVHCDYGDGTCAHASYKGKKACCPYKNGKAPKLTNEGCSGPKSAPASNGEDPSSD